MADFFTPRSTWKPACRIFCACLQHPALKVRVPHQALEKPVQEAQPKCRVKQAVCKHSYLTLSLPNVAKGKIQQKIPNLFCEILKNK